jgi:hypothetical protein
VGLLLFLNGGYMGKDNQIEVYYIGFNFSNPEKPFVLIGTHLEEHKVVPINMINGEEARELYTKLIIGGKLK